MIKKKKERKKERKLTFAEYRLFQSFDRGIRIRFDIIIVSLIAYFEDEHLSWSLKRERERERERKEKKKKKKEIKIFKENEKRKKKS